MKRVNSDEKLVAAQDVSYSSKGFNLLINLLRKVLTKDQKIIFFI